MKQKNGLLGLVCFLLLSLCSTAVSGQVSDTGKIEDFVRPFAEANQFSGVVLAAKDGKVIYEKAFGLANVEHGVPTKTDTKFGIASINKPMTSVILIRLIEAGKISLDDKLSKYIPDFPKGDKITIGLIARHRSGIPHRVMPAVDEAKRFTPAQFVEVVKKAELAFEPGAEELYSSAGYAVLARVLEIVTGKPFGALLQEYVFDPAAMKDSTDFDSRNILRDKAESYFLGLNGYEATPIVDYGFLVGAGSVFSTARDIYKFGMAHIEGKYGDIAQQNWVREGVFRSNGSTNGYRSNIRIDSKKKYAYVLVSNLGSGANDLILNNLQNLLEGKEIVKPEIPNPKIDDKIKNNLADYPGSYKLGGSGFEILIDDERLFAGPFRLYPIGKDKFYNFWSYAEVTFVRDPSGKVNGLEWVGSGGKTDWVRQ